MLPTAPPRCSLLLAPAALLLLLSAAAGAAPDLYTHDAAGVLATVDVETGTVTPIGNMGVEMTDIAFAPDGRLFGISFTSFYEIDPETAVPTFIGNHGVSGGNALVFGGDDVIYAAGASGDLYQIDPTNGAGTVIGDLGLGVASAGDLAFNGPDFFLSTTAGDLLQIDLGPPATGAVVGSLGFPDVFGLATADDGVLYGISGTQIFAVDTATGAGTPVVDFGGQGLGPSFGSTFLGEALPTCPSVPRPNCLVAAKAKLKIKEKKPGAEKLALQLKGFSGPTAQIDFGDPVGGATRYDVCLFDGAGRSLVRLTVDRAAQVCGSAGKPCWKAKGTKGFGYKDPDASASGVRKIASSSGPAGKGKLSVQAGNKAPRGQIAMPHGIAPRLTGETSVFVQVAASDALCFEATLGTVKKADGVQFKAKAP